MLSSGTGNSPHTVHHAGSCKGHVCLQPDEMTQTGRKSTGLSGKKLVQGQAFHLTHSCKFYFLHQNCNYVEFIAEAGLQQCSYASLKGHMFNRVGKRI